jgi:hypothetical protein
VLGTDWIVHDDNRFYQVGRLRPRNQPADKNRRGTLLMNEWDLFKPLTRSSLGIDPESGGLYTYRHATVQ